MFDVRNLDRVDRPAAAVGVDDSFMRNFFVSRMFWHAFVTVLSAELMGGYVISQSQVRNG